MGIGNTVEIIFADRFDPDESPSTWKYKFRGLKHGESVSIYIGKNGRIHDVNAFGIFNMGAFQIEEQECIDPMEVSDEEFFRHKREIHRRYERWFQNLCRGIRDRFFVVKKGADDGNGHE